MTENNAIVQLTSKLDAYLKKRKTTMLSKTMIALPNNVGEAHWQLLLFTNPAYVRTHNKSHLAQVFLFDSLSQPTNNTMYEEMSVENNETASIMSTVIKNLCSDHLDVKQCLSYKKLHLVRVTPQCNGNDC